MKHFKILLMPLLLIVVLSTSCERDDICPESTPTTPSLIIDMLDFENQESSKNVFNLVVAGIQGANSLVLPGFDIVTTNQLVLPLKTDEDFTQYILIKDGFVNDARTPDTSDDDFFDGSNFDTITINYSREEVYVSRACGYKTIFKNVTITIEDDGDRWLLSQQPLNPNQSVEDETTTHFNIFH